MKNTSSAVLQTKMALSGENVESLTVNTEGPILLPSDRDETLFTPSIGVQQPKPRLVSTPENRAAAQASLKARRAAGAHLRRNFADAEVWAEMARTRHLRLPEWTVAMTPGGMQKWLRRCGVTITEYRAWSGFRTLPEFITANQEWPLRAFVGLMLEVVEYRK